MNCDDLLRQMNEFVDGNLQPGVCDELREHLKGCDPCRVVVDNIRNTVTIYKNGLPLELSAECRHRLHSLVRDRWRERFPAQK